jgi:hypothetical protein
MANGSDMRKPMVAGLLMLIAGTFNILWLVSVFARILDAKELLHTTWVITPFPWVILDVGFGGNNAAASLLAIAFLVGIILSIIGGIFALRRRAWRIALAGSIGILICVPILGIAAIMLTAISKRSFVK